MQLRVTHGLWLGLALAVALPATAQDQTRSRSQSTMNEQMREQPVYGSQLMTPAEMRAYQEQMRNATTAQERERIRAEHHQQMQERAQARGITLPDEPPAQGSMGGGMGPGNGMGPGGGMGSGSGMGSGGGTGPGGGMAPGDGMGPRGRR